LLQHRVHERCFSVVDVSNDGDITNVVSAVHSVQKMRHWR
jgi:hypothetical protein